MNTNDSTVPERQSATLAAAHEAFFTDVGIAVENLQKNDSAFNRRTLIRTIYAAAEAWTNWIKQAALEAHQNGGSRFSIEEIAVLRDETYYLDRNGKIRKQPRFSPPDANFRFAVETFFVKHPRIPMTIDWSAPGWNDFKIGLVARDRLTHPKTRKDLVVTDEEVRAARSGHDFIRQAILGHLIFVLESTGHG